MGKKVKRLTRKRRRIIKTSIRIDCFLVFLDIYGRRLFKMKF